MTSGFWFLEDGRGFARRTEAMGYFLSLINHEIEKIEGAKPFSEYLSQFVPNEEDIPNSYGGFIRTSTGKSIMQVFDLRGFIVQNQRYFWLGTQTVLKKLIVENAPKKDALIHSL